MWPRFGIKIGNSTLCIASVKSDSAPEVIANKQGDRVSQACLLAEGSEIECGLTAKQKMASKPASCVANSLQFFLSQPSMTEEKIREACKYITCYYNEETKEFELKSKSNGDSDKEIITKISPHQVCVNFYKAEFDLARQSYLHEDKPSVVLSIPNCYPNESWPSLAAAAEEAGFHVAQIISETTAAALAYGIGESQTADSDEVKIVLCIKSGGLFSSFTLYQVAGGMYTLLEDVGPFPIGGNQYTDVLVEFVCQEFYKKYRLDPKESRRSMAKIYTASTNCKHILTALPSNQIYIDSLMDGVDFSMQMSRARYEMLIQPVINKFMVTLNEAVEKLYADNKTTVKQIDEIVLLGATMKIPKIQAAISSRFPDAKLHSSYAADEVVAIGCARQATFLIDPEGQDLNDKAVCLFIPSDLKIWHGEAVDKSTIILKKGSLVPTVAVVEVDKDENDTSTGDGKNVEVFHLKGEAEDAMSNVSLSATPTPEGKFKVEASIDVKEDGVTTVVTLRCL